MDDNEADKALKQLSKHSKKLKEKHGSDSVEHAFHMERQENIDDEKTEKQIPGTTKGQVDDIITNIGNALKNDWSKVKVTKGRHR